MRQEEPQRAIKQANADSQGATARDDLETLLAALQEALVDQKAPRAYAQLDLF
jgi:hypothetical protein